MDLYSFEFTISKVDDVRRLPPKDAGHLYETETKAKDEQCEPPGVRQGHQETAE